MSEKAFVLQPGEARYFDELAAAVRSGNVADDTLAAIAERYGMEVLGPVPEDYA